MNATEELDLHAWDPRDDWPGDSLDDPFPCRYCGRDQDAHAADFEAWRGTSAFALADFLCTEAADVAGCSDDESNYESLRRAIELLTIAGADPTASLPEPPTNPRQQG